MIKSTAEWGWANNEVAQNDLTSAITALERAVAGDTFTKTFLTMSVGDWKKTYNEDQITTQCGSMSQMLDKLVKTVTVETQSLVNMHAARMKAVNAA